MAANPPFELHPHFAIEELRDQFTRQGWTQLHPFLREDHALRLRDHLLERDDWVRSFRVDRAPPVRLDKAAWAALGRNQRDAIYQLVAPAQDRGFRYLFDEITAVGDDFEEHEPSTLLGEFARFLSSESVLDLVRQITGIGAISRADARATRYGPGQFLTRHNDDVEGKHRRAAYVFGLTPTWRPEWGGLLLFHDEREDIERGLLPRMNALNLFTVPKQHSVSLVAPFVTECRYAVTGWLRSPTAG